MNVSLDAEFTKSDGSNSKWQFDARTTWFMRNVALPLPESSNEPSCHKADP
jgi:hypothetical protein